VDDSFLVLFNASSEPRKWTISGHWGDTWERVLDTALDGPDPDGDEPLRGDLILTDRSVVVLRKLDPFEPPS